MPSKINTFARFDLSGPTDVPLHFNTSSFCSVVCQRAAGLGLNATEPEQNVPMAWDHSVDENTIPSSIDHEDMEEDEEDEEYPTVPMYLVDDSIRGELK